MQEGWHRKMLTSTSKSKWKVRLIRKIRLETCTVLQKQLVSLKFDHRSPKCSHYLEYGQLHIPRAQIMNPFITVGDVNQNETLFPKLGKLPD